MNREWVADLLRSQHPDRVFLVEPDVVWVSSINQNSVRVAEQLSETLAEHDVPVGTQHPDSAVWNNGVEFRYGHSV